MACKECDIATTKPDKPKPAERVFPGYPFHAKDAIGTWLYPCAEGGLCSYHRRKAEGQFDRDPEYYRLNIGPHEWTQYGK